jgi:hypothetical protein
VTEKIRSSDKTKFINRFNMGTKREFVGMPVDLIGEPQAWEAVVLPLNYARARRQTPAPQDNAKAGRGKAGTASALALRVRALRLRRSPPASAPVAYACSHGLTEMPPIRICMRKLQAFAAKETTR